MEQNQSGFKRFWYIWGAVIIKYVIAQVMYVIALISMVAYDMVGMSFKEQINMIFNMLFDQEQLLRILLPAAEKITDYTVLIEGAAAIVTIPVMIWLFCKDCKRDKEEGIVQERAPLWKYGAVILLAAAAGLGLNNLIFLSDMSSFSASYDDTLKVLYNPPMAVQLVVLGVLMPLCEELVFRGVVYRRLRYTEGYMTAALYSSLIFAAIHGNLVQILYGFAMGMLFANMYERYGSVKAPIIAHIAANVISVVMTEYKLFDWLFEEPVRVGVSTVLCAAIGATMYVIIQKIGSNESLTE